MTQAKLRPIWRVGKWRTGFAALLAVLTLLAGPAQVQAVQPDEVLADPALEARAREISAGLRCLVCQNQSIDDSNAPLARDLRIIVRERLKAGDSNAEVRAYLVDRFGEFVLLRPPLNIGTALLWLTPVLLLVASGFAGWRFITSRQVRPGREADGTLTPEEAKRLKELLERSD